MFTRGGFGSLSRVGESVHRFGSALNRGRLLHKLNQSIPTDLDSDKILIDRTETPIRRFADPMQNMSTSSRLRSRLLEVNHEPSLGQILGHGSDGDTDPTHQVIIAPTTSVINSRSSGVQIQVNAVKFLTFPSEVEGEPELRPILAVPVISSALTAFRFVGHRLSFVFPHGHIPSTMGAPYSGDLRATGAIPTSIARSGRRALRIHLVVIATTRRRNLRAMRLAGFTWRGGLRNRSAARGGPSPLLPAEESESRSPARLIERLFLPWREANGVSRRPSGILPVLGIQLPISFPARLDGRISLHVRPGKILLPRIRQLVVPPPLHMDPVPEVAGSPVDDHTDRSALFVEKVLNPATQLGDPFPPPSRLLLTETAIQHALVSTSTECTYQAEHQIA